MESYDVVIVGGGPAGLSAALTLGRARRRALLVDGGTPRNARAHEVRTFVTRDGTPPKEFRRIAREQLAPYDTVAVRDAFVDGAVADDTSFVVTIGKEQLRARKLLLAVGVVDEPPAIEGMDRHWGHSAFACPYCHGFEVRERPWGVLASNDAIAEWAFMLLGWTKNLTAFTNGAEISAEIQARLVKAGVVVETENIASLEGGEHLETVLLRSGKRVPCGALYVRPAQRAVALVDALELERDEQGYVRVDPKKESSTKGVFVAGDATTMMQSALAAAAEGMVAAAMINHALANDDYGPR
jgi:thioredoxin reductase